MRNRRKTIETVDQVRIAKAIFNEIRKSVPQKIGDSTLIVDWIHLPQLVYVYNLPYHKTRRFVLKLVRQGYATSRAPSLRGPKKKPFDFVLTNLGKKELKAELKGISDRISFL